MMGYANMDHAGWVERNAAAAKSRSPKNLRPGRECGWDAAPETLSPFQARVFDILGIVGGGIYNAPIGWDRVNWRGYGKGLAVVWRGSLSTFDFMQLTRPVFLCHEARIRCEIEVANFGALRLVFFPRVDVGGMGERHPSLDEAVAEFRRYLPADHRIFYDPDEPQNRIAVLRHERRERQYAWDQIVSDMASDDGMPIREAA